MDSLKKIVYIHVKECDGRVILAQRFLTEPMPAVYGLSFYEHGEHQFGFYLSREALIELESARPYFARKAVTLSCGYDLGEFEQLDRSDSFGYGGCFYGDSQFRRTRDEYVTMSLGPEKMWHFGIRGLTRVTATIAAVSAYLAGREFDAALRDGWSQQHLLLSAACSNGSGGFNFEVQVSADKSQKIQRQLERTNLCHSVGCAVQEVWTAVACRPCRPECCRQTESGFYVQVPGSATCLQFSLCQDHYCCTTYNCDTPAQQFTLLAALGKILRISI